jgi:hypothetical protein
LLTDHAIDRIASGPVRFSILEHSAGISWPEPQPAAAAERAAVGRVEAEERPRGAAVAASTPAAPDAAVEQPRAVAGASRASPPRELVAAAARPGAAAQPAEFAASTRPAEAAWELLGPVWVEAAAVERSAFVSIPERPALFQEAGPNRQPSVGHRPMPVHSIRAPSDLEPPGG